MKTEFPSNLETIWQAIAERISAQVTRDTYERWFKAISMTAADENDITLTVPNNIYQLWIESNYLSLLQSSIASVLSGPRSIHFVSASEIIPAPKSNGRSTEAGESREQHESDDSARGHHSKSRAHSRDAAGAAHAPVVGGMNPRNTFATFVVGANNQFAHAASLAVSQAPSRTYNPLFIYGGVGLGKTHLMQAIGQHVVERNHSSKVMYLSSERFTNEFIDAIQNNSLVRFRKRYRQADVLLIDDIQFFSGKERSQEEFFHTFNTLFDGHKQIVLSSDRPPAEIQNLEQRLVSRFEWGLTAELQPPDIETRVAILRKKAESLSIKLDSDIFDFLAQRIRTNVRRLEGALMRVASFASLSETPIGTEAIEHLLKDILHEESRRTVTIDLIQRKVAEHFDVRVADMTSKRRPQNIAFPRQIAMYLARELTKSSLAEIGEAFGGRDHGTVLHAHRLVQERMRNEEKIRQTVSFLDSHLNR
ncbi:MAG: chromosomal replication initiator protein DnaA [Chthoniobacteraceae bacterium]|jgi:chromosomal replication initiator protein